MVLESDKFVDSVKHWRLLSVMCAGTGIFIQSYSFDNYVTAVRKLTEGAEMRRTESAVHLPSPLPLPSPPPSLLLWSHLNSRDHV